eukprot:scaffold239896_cov17-Tisochrysis_lutea.AAC.1
MLHNCKIGAWIGKAKLQAVHAMLAFSHPMSPCWHFHTTSHSACTCPNRRWLAKHVHVHAAAPPHVTLPFSLGREIRGCCGRGRGKAAS